VELFSVVVDACLLDVFEKWIPELIKIFVKLAASCSIKSGFFELLTAVFQRGSSEVNVKTENDFLRMMSKLEVIWSLQECYEQSFLELKSFLIETMMNISKFKGVDLSTCLRMILKIPCSILEIVTFHIVPILQVSTKYL
jgi:hypothetical protein